MKLFSKTVTAFTIATATAFNLAQNADAATFNVPLLFQTSAQSIWDTGNEFRLNDSRFLGVDWNESASVGFRIPIPFRRDINVGLGATTRGSIGLQSNFSLEGGQVNALIPVNLLLTLPDTPIKAGESFTVKTDFAFAPQATFLTSSPQSTYGLDSIFQLATSLDINPGTVLDLGFDTGRQTNNLVTINTQNLAIDTSGSLGSFNARFPQLNTLATNRTGNTLFSSVEDRFLTGSVDLDLIATRLFGLPPLEASASIRLGVVGNLGARYNLLDAQANAALSLQQNFSLTGNLPAVLRLENGLEVPFQVGQDITLTMPSGVGESLDIDATIDFDALFSNRTSLGFDLGLDIRAGEFGLEIPVIPDVSIGPLFRRNINLVDSSLVLYDKSFKLSGFNRQNLSFRVATVPEPSTILGKLIFGVLGTISVLKQRTTRDKRI
ncbi:MAG: hypothetical protein VKL59_25830 [Nostocaceae cyanobacterium]|nr:hypothetical protein [Nostocaceae cyanobacterium]